MSRPWEDLAEHIASIPVEVPVYATPTEQMDAPCYVITPGDPWIDPDATHASFGAEPERYELWAVAKGALGWAATPLVHSMLHAVRHNLPDGFAFESAGSFGQLDHQGITYFGAPLRLTYNACDEGASS